MALRIYCILFCAAISGISYGQQQIIHKPQTAIVIPGLRREFKADLAKLSIEVNPGWQATEINDTIEHIYQLVFTNPEDSLKMISLLMQHFESKDFDTIKWSSLKKSVLESYGNRGIPLHPLSDHVNDSVATDKTGILARYELLAKKDGFLEYINAIAGKTFLILLSVPLKKEEYAQKVPYFKAVAESIKIGG